MILRLNCRVLAFLSTTRLKHSSQKHFLLNVSNQNFLRSQKISSTVRKMASPTLAMKNNSENGNYNLAQSQNELFDLYFPPPSSDHCNTIVKPEWGELYFPSPKRTGETKIRSLVHRDGDWHRSVHIWLVQVNGNSVNVLLQRRSPYKDTYPNQLDVSCAGHVNAGDGIIPTVMRELDEELNGNGYINTLIKCDHIENSKAFTIACENVGETEKFGKFTCREYQDIFILWLNDDIPLISTMFAPRVLEEVAGFVIADGKELIQKLRDNDFDLVPKSREYINALEQALHLKES